MGFKLFTTFAHNGRGPSSSTEARWLWSISSYMLCIMHRDILEMTIDSVHDAKPAAGAT